MQALERCVHEPGEDSGASGCSRQLQIDMDISGGANPRSYCRGGHLYARQAPWRRGGSPTSSEELPPLIVSPAAEALWYYNYDYCCY